MGYNTQLEDLTVNVSSSSNVNITAIHFPDDTPITAKLTTLMQETQ
jgi:hypothetical protein